LTAVFVPSYLRMKKLWLPVLPIWICSIVLSVLLAINGLTVLIMFSLLLNAALGVLLGMLLALDLPRTRSRRFKAEKLDAVDEIIRKIGGALDLQVVLDSITTLTVDLTGVRGCSIKLWDNEAGRMLVRSMAGIKREKTDLTIDVAKNLYHRSLMEGKAVLVEEAFEKDFPEVDDHTESLICVPLRNEEGVLGALCVYGKKGERLTQQMISLFGILGNLVTLSITNASVYENLKNLDQAKTWFLLKASHELRSPLNTIQSITGTLLQGYLGPLSNEQKDMLSRIESRTAALSASVNDLLVLARGKSGLATLELEKLNLCHLLRESAVFFRTRAEEKGLTLKVDCPVQDVYIYGKEEGLTSVITNLLSNAVKYTPAGGTVSLHASQNEDQVLIEVRDTGIGIPREEQKYLFKEFFRASNARELTEMGTGLGLPIVRSTVEQYGGSIEFESEEGKGTAFRITLYRVGF